VASSVKNKRRKSNARLIWGLVLLLAVLAFAYINAPGALALYYKVRYSPEVDALRPAPGYQPDDRVLVLSPHPDDEALCCAGMIQHALKAGAEVYIVHLTSGDGFEWDAVLLERTASPGPRGLRALGVRRMDEAREAARILGVPEENLFFLGYPDRGLLRLFLQHYHDPYRSGYTALNRVPYSGTVSPGALYTGRNLERDLRQVVTQVNPTVVLSPSPLDTHPDHQATAYLAVRILSERDEVHTLRYWILHGGLQWPLPKGWHRSLPLFPPPRGALLPWLRVDLAPEEQAVKEQAILAHGSQMQILFRYMSAFVRTNELVSPLPLPVP
jgi:LmbE family N-acetylglucosaminyl deacetylase